MRILEYFKNRHLIKQLQKLNPGKIDLLIYVEEVYQLNTQLSLDDIVFPDNLRHEICMRDDGNGIQIVLYDPMKNKIGVLDCKEPVKTGERRNPIAVEVEEKEEEKKPEVESVEIEKKNPKIEKFEFMQSDRYDAYREFLVRAGAREDLIDLPAVDEIIQDSIRHGDPRVVFERRSPVHYSDQREDGTFDICARKNGPCVSDIYHIQFCGDNNPNHFISITHEAVNEYSVPLFEGVRYVNKHGEYVDVNQKKLK